MYALPRYRMCSLTMFACYVKVYSKRTHSIAREHIL